MTFGEKPKRAVSSESSNDELRVLLRQLKAEAASNEQKWQRTLEREVELLRAETLPSLLELLTSGLSKSYALDAVQLILEDEEHEIQHLLVSSGSRLEDFEGLTFVDRIAEVSAQLSRLHRPWLGVWMRADHELLFSGRKRLQSIALMPLTLKRKTIGFLCFGSVDPERFSHRLGANFFQHLATVVAICLENTCNRARIVRSGLADYLTGWHNRRYLEARLREELARAQRGASSVAFLMIDVDNFKQLNDSYGHVGGDIALRTITERIQAQIRASDSGIRFGGDELAVLLPDASLDAAAGLGERIRAAMKPPINLGRGKPRKVTLSIGVAAVAPDRGESDLGLVAEQLLARADGALYQAKAAGRNRVIIG